MTDDLKQLQTDFSQRIAEAASVADLRAVESELLGKKGALTQLKRTLGDLDAEQRKQMGAALNEAKNALEAAIETRGQQLRKAELAAQIAAEKTDLTEFLSVPARGTRHLVTQTWDHLVDVFVGMGFTVAEGPEVESDWYNFEALNIPAAHPARGMWDTLYVDYGEPETVLLRTHTSPVQIRVMTDQPPPIYSVMPGRVYRRDTADASHMPVFHQIEGLVVDRGISFADLAGTLEAFTSAYFGGAIHSRLRPSYFPFTEPSAEYDINCLFCQGDGCRTCGQTGWLELGGRAMVHPNVLRNAGLDSEEWSGFAFGFGLDRLALMRHGVDDIREMYTGDVRFLEQFPS